jgi:predicted esterase
MIVFCNTRTILLVNSVLLLLAIASCGGKKKSPSETKPLTYNQITRKVCKADSSQSYEVYFPSGFSSQKKWPVIYTFDPHADGKLAVEHFMEASERFGYIVIGSNNSENGMQTLDHTLEILINDVQKEFVIDVNRQYAGGFSGGGRVALYLAAKTGSIKGIITCGAGLTGFNPQNYQNYFDIYAIAGREDFNYDEVMNIPELFDGTGWRHIATGFNGGHEWPPAHYITNAIKWFQCNAMRDKIIPKDEQFLEQEFDSTKLRCEEYLDNHKYIKAADECITGIASLKGLLDITKLNNKLDKIKDMEAYRTDKQKEIQMKYEEQQLRKNLLEGFTNRDLGWWDTELKNLNGKIATEQDLSTMQMYKRIKGFLGIVCYSYTGQAISENNTELAEKCVGIYEIVEPENSDCFFYKAQLLDRKNKTIEAAETLKKAISLGFKDTAKIKKTFSGKVLKLVF